MKKILALVLVLMVVLGCSALAAEDKLILYGSTPEPYLTDMINGFTESTGIEVELITGGTSELFNRVAAGEECDILRGGMMWGSYVPIKDTLMQYESPFNAELPDNCKCIFGCIYGFSYVGTVIMVNNDALAKIGVDPAEIKGFEDLLNPALKGQVTIPDPTSTSSGWEDVVNMLFAMGGGDTDAGWEYFDKLMANGLVIASGSSACHKSCADGEYAVAVVTESMVMPYISAGQNVSVVWPEEGTIMNSDGIAAMANAPHPEYAQKFLDYIISDTYQNIQLIQDPQLRPVKDNLENECYLTPNSEIKMIDCDYEYIAANKTDMLDHCKDIMTNYM